MSDAKLSKIRLVFTGLVALVTWSTLVWQYFGAGVPAHHLLHNPDLPALSNWWGGLLLPLLTWVLLSIIHKRIRAQDPDNANVYPVGIIGAFVGAVVYGLALGQAFLTGNEQVSSILFFGIPVIGIFLRVYRPEYVLGFILSMSVTFGAILSTLFGSIIALVAFVVYSVVHFVRSRIGKADTPNV